MAVSNNYSISVGVRLKTDDIRRQLEAVNGKFTLTVNVRAEGLEQLQRNAQATTSSVQNLNRATTAVNTTLNNTSTTAKKVSSDLKGTSRSAEHLGQSFADIVKKVGTFYLASVPIQMMQDAVLGAIDTIKEFDDALTEFKKVSDLSGESLDNYTKKLGELGTELGRTRTEMISSAQEFVKSGYSEEDSAKLARVSEMYRNVADAELTSAESAGFIISQMKAYGDETEDFAMHTINAINNVSNNMAVSSSDISTALSKTSSAMATLGNSFEETVAMVTSGTQIMHGQASKVGRGLRTVGNNIASLAQQQRTLAVETQNGTKQIQLYDEATGDMKNTYQVLEQIAQEWDNMSNAQKQAIGISLSGKNQFEVFSSVVSGFADAQKAVTLATDSENSALNENSKYMESISA